MTKYSHRLSLHSVERGLSAPTVGIRREGGVMAVSANGAQSLVALDMTGCVVAGEPRLWRFASDRGPALYLVLDRVRRPPRAFGAALPFTRL